MVTLRPHQIAAADAVEDAFRAGCMRPLVDSCVGSGKSLIYAELARRAVARGERALICAHTRELVEQNARAARSLGLTVGVNAAALGERTWRAPVISAAIQSIYKHGASFGLIALVMPDECHMLPHSESGMYRELIRSLGSVRVAGGSGTVFRLQGGSLVEGEGAPFDRVVFRYSIVDGIRDGFLVPAFSVTTTEKMNPSKLRTRQGEYTGESQDAQMIAAMDNHIAQMVYHGKDRRAWLVFEASVKAAQAMTKRMNEWGISTGCVLGETPAAERAAMIAAFRTGRLRAMVSRDTLTTGFDVQEVDLLVMRRRTKSLGLYLQMTGRLLRTIGGDIETSIRAGKPNGVVLDFAGNIDSHGPLDFIRPKETKASLVSCDACGTRNAGAAMRCWKCDEPMTKLCPACLEPVRKGVVDCPWCKFDMRVGPRREDVGDGLLDVPTGAALIRAFAGNTNRAGGWVAIRKCHVAENGDVIADTADRRVTFPSTLKTKASVARWVRFDGDAAVAILVPNGQSRSSAIQVNSDGSVTIVPMPQSEPSSEGGA